MDEENEVLYTHTLGDNVLGEVEFKTPYRMTFVYPSGRELVVKYVKRMQVMKTGCYVLHTNDYHRRIYVIPPGQHLYCVEQPESRLID